MTNKLHIKKGDKVKILSGESRKKIGIVQKILRSTNRVILEGEGIKTASRHTKPDAKNPDGGIIQKAKSIHISNLMLVDDKDVAQRVGRKKDEKGKSVRYFKKSQEVVAQ